MQINQLKIKVPFVWQINEYFCGPAALQMIFSYFNYNKPQEELAKMMDTKEFVGTKKEKMVEAVHEHDFHYCEKDNSSLEEVGALLKNNAPVVVNFIEPTDEESHYAVVIGLTDKEIIFADPWNGKDFKISREDFLKRWYGHEDDKKRWILAVCEKEFCGCKCSSK